MVWCVVIPRSSEKKTLKREAVRYLTFGDYTHRIQSEEGGRTAFIRSLGSFSSPENVFLTRLIQTVFMLKIVS